MPHIHELIDFTIAAYIVHKGRVLLVHHKKLDRWLPIGGHIELDEDPEQALFREIKEESGLEVEVAGTKPQLNEPGTKSLIPPMYLNIHKIDLSHRHVGLIYFARTESSKVSLSVSEHNDIRWLTAADLSSSQYELGEYIRFYASKALEYYSEGVSHA